MANTFKKVIDRMIWAQVTPSPNAHTTATSMCSDLRNNSTRNPFVYNLISNTILNRYNIITKGWQVATSAAPITAGTFGVGSTMAFAPSFGAVGVIAAGATTTSVTLSTALPTAVGVNMLANRGGSGELGFRIRIIDNVVGKIEERWIVGNTTGTTPVITVDTAFSFTPSNGARYEILCGRVLMLGAAALGAGIFRSFEPASNTLSSLGTTNLPGTINVDSAMLVLDEQYVPFDMAPGEGMVKGSFSYDTGVSSLTATNTALGTLTGQATGGDAVVLANEYRNFQIRIVQDTVNPTAVGQRRIILSHTAGASPVYTLGSNWTVTPSTNAKYVIELPNLLVLRSTAALITYTYNYTDATITRGGDTIAANAWSTAYFAAPSVTLGAGCVWAPSFGIQPDPARNSRHSHCFFFRGGAAVTLDLFDIAGAATGSWTAGVTYDGNVNPFGAGTTASYAPFGQEGRFTYVNVYVASQLSQIYRFDAKSRVFSPYVQTDFIQAGTALQGGRMATYCAIDGADEYAVVLLQAHTSTICQELICLV